MYKNIGGKLKALAMGICIFVSILEFLAGIGMIAVSDGSGELIATGICMMLFGPVISWISSWILYGFGELIDKASAIERNTRKEEEKPETQPKAVSPDFGKGTISRNY